MTDPLHTLYQWTRAVAQMRASLACSLVLADYPDAALAYAATWEIADARADLAFDALIRPAKPVRCSNG